MLPLLHADVRPHTHIIETALPLIALGGIGLVAALAVLFLIRSRKA